MSDAKKKVSETIDYVNLSKVGTTKEILNKTNEIREAKREEVEKENAAYVFPEGYSSTMGLKQGSVTELRMFFNVKPGHAEALKEALLKFQVSEERNAKAVHIMTGIVSMTGTFFDNDTRYLHCAEFDTEWDPYIDDSVPGPKQRLIYANWIQHLVEGGDFGPDNLPTANDVKVFFNMARKTAHIYIRTFGETATEEYRMRDVKKAFDEVLDNPDAATALQNPALKPLLDLAAE